jgi:hypothetical protein
MTRAAGTVIGQRLQFEKASLIGVREAAQVHGDQIAFRHQPRHRWLPAVIAAEELVHAIAAVRVRAVVDLGETALEVAWLDDETVAQPATEEVEELIPVDRAGGEVRGSELDGAGIAPAGAEQVEEPLGPALGWWPASRRCQPDPPHA